MRGRERVGKPVQPGADVVVGGPVVEGHEQRDAAGAVEHEECIEAVRPQRSAGEASRFAQVGVGRGAGGFEEDAGHAERSCAPGAGNHEWNSTACSLSRHQAKTDGSSGSGLVCQ